MTIKIVSWRSRLFVGKTPGSGAAGRCAFCSSQADWVAINPDRPRSTRALCTNHALKHIEVNHVNLRDVPPVLGNKILEERKEPTLEQVIGSVPSLAPVDMRERWVLATREYAASLQEELTGLQAKILYITAEVDRIEEVINLYDGPVATKIEEPEPVKVSITRRARRKGRKGRQPLSTETIRSIERLWSEGRTAAQIKRALGIGEGSVYKYRPQPQPLPHEPVLDQSSDVDDPSFLIPLAN